MTRKDYELLARTLGAAEARGKRGTDGAARVAASGMAGVMFGVLCDALAVENPRFDRAKFGTAWIIAGEQEQGK
jgi:hypothetical protein